ncbi:MAG: GNAT family N-acetyltransferase [Cyanobacteria bacterium RM1_2_2]|nr:GNAT family N-acetyltransferase [Cyanobacteria bacterium RM1_2_2]
MSIHLSYDTTNVDWNAVAYVMEMAPLAKRDPEQLRRACQNSAVVVFAYDQTRIVGWGRAISDGEFCAAVYDVVVLPEYQGCGVGRSIITALLERLPSHSVTLYATPGKEAFYKKLGFHPMKTSMGKFSDVEQMRRGGYIEG